MAGKAGSDLTGIIDLAFEDAIKSKLTEIICANLGHGTGPYVKDDQWKTLRDKIDSEGERQKNRTSTDDENALWVYLTSEEWMTWYDRFFQAVIGVATLGAGFTFSVIVSSLEIPNVLVDDQAEQKRQVDRIRFYLSLSWLLFVLSLSWASFAAQIMDVNKRMFMNSIDRANWDTSYRGLRNRPWLFSTTATLIAQLLPIAAFWASASAVKAYQYRTGLAAIIILANIAFILIVAWSCQNL